MSLTKKKRRAAFVLGALVMVMAVLALTDRIARHLFYRQVYSERVRDAQGLPGFSKDYIRFKPDPLLSWRYHDSAALRIQTLNTYTAREVEYVLRTNALGLRGPEVEVPKPPGTLRILAMGGSSTVGPGAKVEQTYVHRLARLLKSRFPGRTVEAVNAGVDGYRAEHGFFHFQRDLRHLQPDLVIVAYDVNDKIEPMSVEDVINWRLPDLGAFIEQGATLESPKARLAMYLAGSSTMERIQGWAFESGIFLSLLHAHRVLTFERTKGSGSQASRALPPPPPSFRCQDPKKLAAIANPFEGSTQRWRAGIRALDLAIKDAGVPAVFLSMPVSNEDLQDLAAPFPYSYEMSLMARARPDRIHVSPAASFCGHVVGEVMMDWVHPTAKGHDLVAQALVPAAIKLLKRGDR